MNDPRHPFHTPYLGHSPIEIPMRRKTVDCSGVSGLVSVHKNLFRVFRLFRLFRGENSGQNCLELLFDSHFTPFSKNALSQVIIKKHLETFFRLFHFFHLKHLHDKTRLT
jgi:hypothetical protein